MNGFVKKGQSPIDWFFSKQQPTSHSGVIIPLSEAEVNFYAVEHFAFAVLHTPDVLYMVIAFAWLLLTPNLLVLRVSISISK